MGKEVKVDLNNYSNELAGKKTEMSLQSKKGKSKDGYLEIRDIRQILTKAFKIPKAIM